MPWVYDTLQSRPIWVEEETVPTTRVSGRGRPFGAGVMESTSTARAPRPTTINANETPVMPGTYTGTLNRSPASSMTFLGLSPDDLRFASDTQIMDMIRQKYPYIGAFLNTNADVRKVLIEGARKGWGESELYGALTGTSWWQNTDAANRTWQRLVAEDPAEANRLAAQTAALVQNKARSLGLTMSAGQIAGLARTATASGWTDEQTIDNLVRSVNWNSLGAGELTALRDNVRRIGAQYLVNVSENTARDYAMAIASGEMTESGVVSAMQRSARTRFSWMADEIDQGVTPSLYFAPLRDEIARTLAMPTEAVNMMDPKWMRLMEVRDQKTGELRAATTDEAMLAARQDPRYANTQDAQERVSQLSAMLSDVFGRRSV